MKGVTQQNTTSNKERLVNIYYKPFCKLTPLPMSPIFSPIPGFVFVFSLTAIS
jgi:hypothetical protein